MPFKGGGKRSRLYFFNVVMSKETCWLYLKQNVLQSDLSLVSSRGI